MSHADHEWTKDNLAAHVAGGLSADERARIEAHVEACPDCREFMSDLRGLDSEMGELFAPARPRPGMEERVIRSLREQRPRRNGVPFMARIGMAAAAVLLMGIIGVIFMGMIEPEPQDDLVAQGPPNGVVPKFRTAAEMADEKGRSGLFAMTKHIEDPVFKKSKLSDHNETVDSEEFEKAKEEFQGYSSDKPFDSKSKYDQIGAGKRVRELQQQLKGIQNNQYSYRNTNPAANPKADATFFRPGDALARMKNKSNLEKDELTEDPGLRKPAPPSKTQDQQKINRKIIRSGEMEFEVESFDSTVAKITEIVGEEQGFVATVNSEKLKNGKIRGTVTVRVPPDNLDKLILKLRALGELKSQRIGSEDITKKYTDLESQLRAARAMEERLINIIKTGKGEIKDLLEAEKQLGEWRTKIERLTGEIRYYNNLISLSTLNLTLYEKEIRTPHGVIQTEKVQMGVEVEDVEKAHQEALKAVADAKGRVTKSELKQYAAGQYNALVYFEVAHDQSGPVRDRLNMLGHVARLDISRDQRTEGGSGSPTGQVTTKQDPSQFFVSIYNVANIAPRETALLHLACGDAEAAYKAILKRIQDAGGRVIRSSLNRQKSDQTTGDIQFQVKTAEAEAVLIDVRKEGEVMKFQVIENPDAQNVTKSKQGFHVQLFALGMVAPRETTQMQVASRDVAAGYRALVAAIQKAKGRILSGNLDETNRNNVTATIDFEVRRDSVADIERALGSAGDIYSRSATRSQDTASVVDSKTRYRLVMINISQIPPRETLVLGVEVGNVDESAGAVTKMTDDAKGRVVESHVSHERNGRIVANMIIEVPLSAASTVTARIRELGLVRVAESSKNPRVPEGKLATARLKITLSNAELLIQPDSGPWAHIKKGLSASLVALSWALTFVIIGLCFLLPLGLIGWGTWKVYRKTRPVTAE